ncbi:VWA domain-containing protein [Lachnospiraceae bacterium DSM 108991]|uniref:VWA domain-containing protein n=1 Tax=Claveliimonas monacensis TaxID=2779351 RepID=A0ABR9RGD4_9FIRM|nr:VWA domain-containing protein [Claveliimonas monacensis]MBE5061665.1 VWA domain-containing protein [Claveliimonas monacensis]
MRKRKFGTALTLFLAFALLLTGCAGSPGEAKTEEKERDASAEIMKADGTIRILSGSENEELEAVIDECSQATGVEIEIDYKGSVDIMRALESGAEEYDAVWPASSIWLSMGDVDHLVKHSQSISMTPVVFGIRDSLAEELGFKGKDVSVKDILAAIQGGKMSFCMTSATQSNSGASAYIGFLYALLGKQEGMTAEDLQGEQLRADITELLGGVERSSGSSDWLKDLFLKEDYDAMVNYECLIIDANRQLESEGKEPLYIVYPYDGLSIADSPLGYVDHGDSQKEEAFQAVQQYLLSKEAQSEIEATGRRISANGVSDENKEVFNEEWGVDTERILSPIQMPDADVLMEALNLYQTSFKKPSLNIYCLDFSGSMEGTGEAQLKDAMSQILLQENASRNFLQANAGEVNEVIFFDNTILDIERAADDSDEALAQLYQKVADFQIAGGTDIYNAAAQALAEASSYDLEKYTPAIILMTDGVSDYNYQTFQEAWDILGIDVPVFSITFGTADPTQLEELAEATGGRVFDGTQDLTEAFRSVKGYN